MKIIKIQLKNFTLKILNKKNKKMLKNKNNFGKVLKSIDNNLKIYWNQ